MSTGARVQFIRVDPSDQARMTSWIHHISRLTGIPVDAAPQHPVFVWQLTAANHRVLGRGAVARETVDEARADVDAIVSTRDRLVARMVRLESSRGYGWVLLDGRDAVLTSARWYGMERDRRESLRSARLGLEMLADEAERNTGLVAAKDGQ